MGIADGILNVVEIAEGLVVGSLHLATIGRCDSLRDLLLRFSNERVASGSRSAGGLDGGSLLLAQ
jgi:hypothetical protein